MNILDYKNNETCLDELISNFSDDVLIILSKYEKEISDELSNAQKNQFTKYLRNKRISKAWFTMLINLPNGDTYFKQIINKVVSQVLGNNYISYFFSGEFTLEMYANCFANAPSKILKQKSFCKIFNIEYDSILLLMQKETGNFSDNEGTDSIDESKTIKKLEKQIKELKEENKRLQNESITKLDTLRDSLNGKIVLQEKQIIDLNEKLANSTSNIKQKEEPTSLDDNQKLKIIFSSLSSEYHLGTIEVNNIKIDQKMVAIAPLFPLLVNADEEKRIFKANVVYRGVYSTFMHFIDNELIEEFCNISFSEYLSKTVDEKFNLLISTFTKKTIIFKPEFAKINENEPFKLNASIYKIIDSEDFVLSTFVPKINANSDILEKIKNKEPFTIDEFSSMLHLNLRYLLIDDDFYEISCVPDNDFNKGIYNWVSTDGKLEKIKVKLSDCQQDIDYILMPNDTGIFIKDYRLKPMDKKELLVTEKDLIDTLKDNAIAQNLCYSEDDLNNFHIALKSSKLVILAGPSGIGKTRLPLLYAKTINLKEDTDTVKFITISPSFLEPNDILGFVKPFLDTQIDDQKEVISGEYQESSTMLVSFLKKASENIDKLHMVIFDEMNLSQIEYWFAPFISLLEREPEERILQLYSSNLNVSNSEKYPNKIKVGENVVFVGTINTDETTKHLSDRLNDRAIIINLTQKSFSSYKSNKPIDEPKPLNLSFGKYNEFLKNKKNYIEEFDDKEIEFFDKIHLLLSKSNAQKGVSFRNLKIISNYLSNSLEIIDRSKAFDLAFKQTIMSKINGSRSELESIITDDTTSGIYAILDEYSSISDFSFTRKLIEEKVKDLNLYGFTK